MAAYRNVSRYLLSWHVLVQPADLRCHSFELYDRRSANLLTATEPLQCSVCRLLVTAHQAVYICQGTNIAATRSARLFSS